MVKGKNKDEILIFSENYIYNNWNSNNQKYYLLRYVLPTEDLDDFNLIKRYSKILESYNFSEIIKKYNFDEYIISIIFKENNTIKVLNKINNKVTSIRKRFSEMDTQDSIRDMKLKTILK